MINTLRWLARIALLIRIQDGGRDRPSETVLPLSQSLGLEVDTSIGRDDVKHVAKAAKKYDGPGNVLICWEHGELVKIAEALGVTK